MLLSPVRLHHDLNALLSSPATSSSTASSSTGAHTALLILPEGRLLASATKYYDNAEDDVVGGTVNGGSYAEEAEDDGEGREGEEQEPYLDEPERIRLLCGLASQWEEDESTRVECELGRLLLTPIPLSRPDPPTTMTLNLPATKGLQPDTFVLVLNGTKAASWTDMTVKAEEFKRTWDDWRKK